MDAAPRISLPERSQRGDSLDIRSFITHPMESGLREDKDGRSVARRIIHAFEARFAGDLVFRAVLRPAVAANPFLRLTIRAEKSGELVCTWLDEGGESWTARAYLEVT
jgi:thiosulfate oxidation carrier complex protein SoxZ